MLKIKDDVDLKELERFEYQFVKFNYIANKPYENPRYIKEVYNDIINRFNLVVVIDNRLISVEKYFDTYYELIEDESSKLYIQDLIQAGLVEKVGE